MLMMANVSEPVPPPTPYIEWLKSLGCLTWLPLTEGDLEDKITETTLTLSGNGAMAWDAEVGMYKFSTPSTVGQYVAILSNGLSASQFANNIFTILSIFQKVTSSSSAFYAEQPSLISTNTNTAASIATALYGNTSKSSSIPSGTHNFAKTIKSDSRVFYYDGAVNGTYAGYAPHLPSNWSVSANGIYLGYRFNSGNNVTYYMKDYYIFNTELPLETIRQIQGYDPLPDGVIR
jgi:hypothetical protein